MSEAIARPVVTFELTSPGGGTVVAAPASGATITLASFANRRIRRLILNLHADAASATDGLTFETRNSAAGTWRIAFSYTHQAATAAQPFTRYLVELSAPFIRVRYTNSASVLTEWEGSLDVDLGGL